MLRSVSSVSEKRTTSGSTAQVPAAPVLRSTMTAAKNTAVANPGCTVGCDCDRYMEVWNNVFSQFNNDGEGHYTELIQKNIDTGMGLERLAVVVQDVDSIFDVDTIQRSEKQGLRSGRHVTYEKDHEEGRFHPSDYRPYPFCNLHDFRRYHAHQ